MTLVNEAMGQWGNEAMGQYMHLSPCRVARDKRLYCLIASLPHCLINNE